MNINYFQYDLPANFTPDSCVAIDTEAMGLLYHRDRLCLVQLTNGDGEVYLIHFPTADFSKSPNLCNLLTNENVQKLFHFARFDVGILTYTFNLIVKNIYCTKIASRLCRTFTSKHGLKNLCKDLLEIEVSKEEQTSDWGAPHLNDKQQMYAATDVIHLHALQAKMNEILQREGRLSLAQECFDFLPTRAQLDILAGDSFDIFSHS